MTGARRGVMVAIGLAIIVALGWFNGPGDDRVEPTTGTHADRVEARTGTDPHSGLPWIAVEDLPAEAHEVLDAIDDGGPYRYDRDDTVFGNFEQLLPDESRGYYREYTVDTPGLDHRGARRIVTGSAEEFYWTEDHYASFERIDR